jgi:hypothetical protein
VLRAPGETETTQENIQDWLQLTEGDPGFQLLTEEEIAAMIYFSTYINQHYLYYYISYLFSKFFFLGPSFASLMRIIG